MKKALLIRAFQRTALSGILIFCMAVLSPYGGWTAFAMENAYVNWAFENDGSFSYEDNKGSWYGDVVTVQAKQGIDIGITKVWETMGDSGQPVVVALIDTGVYTAHPDLSGCLWINPGETAGDGIDNDGNGYIDDTNGWNFYDGTNEIYSQYSNVEDAHGTHCAGLICANGTGMEGVCGGSPDVSVMVLKVLGGTNASGSVSNIIKAIRYAEENGAAICNLSVGFKRYDEELYQTMKDSSMLFVVAAGNGGSDTYGIGWDLAEGKRYPACYELDNMIVAANLTCDGTLHYSSCYGMDYVDLAVPGTQLCSAASLSGYSYMTGTSMSAAILSGMAALLYTRHPEWDIFDLKNAILNTVSPLSELSGMVKTGGMPNAAAAMEWDENAEGAENQSESTEGGNADVEAGAEQSENGDGNAEEPENQTNTEQAEIESGNSDVPGNQSESTEAGNTADSGNQTDTEQSGIVDGNAGANVSQSGNKEAQKKAQKAVSGYPKARLVRQGKKKFTVKLCGNGKADGIQIQWKQKSGKKSKEYHLRIPAKKQKWAEKSIAKRRILGKLGKYTYGNVTKIRVRYYKKQGGRYFYGKWKTL